MMDVDEQGNVYIKNKKVKPYKDIDGYLCKNHKKIHRLVALKYIPNPDNKKTVNHKNGIKTDNRVENLEWMSFSENAKHSWENGLAKPCFGEKHGRSIVDDIQVLTMRTFPIVKNGRCKYHNKYFSKLYKISQTRVSNIRNGLEWKHIPMIHE